MQRKIFLFIFASLVSLQCGRRHLARTTFLGIGDACTPSSQCRPPLRCGSSLVCEPPGDIPLGEACVLNADCALGLRCAAAVCASAGQGVEGSLCDGSGECLRDLRCVYTGAGGRCEPYQNGDIGDACTTVQECAAPLFCDSLSRRCVTELPAPVGESCSDSSDCDSAHFIVCLPDGTCGGTGPDGVPVPSWTGASCSTGALQGSFRVLFEVQPTGDDFFRMPFPNDSRITSQGFVDLSGFPTPPLSVVPDNLLGHYIEAIEAEQQGFGPGQSVFLRFSGPPKFCASGCGTAGNSPCDTGCMGANEPAQTVYVVDLTRDSGSNFLASPFSPVSYHWAASTGRTPYLCPNWLALTPEAETPWRPGHTYFVFVHTRVVGLGGETQVQDANFQSMLQPTAPTASLLGAWNAYEPLRAWLASNPTYPVTLDPVVAAGIGAGALFTVRDPTVAWTTLADEAATGVEPAVTDFGLCAGTSCSANVDFSEFHGTVSLPIYQQGDAPYLTSGGGIPGQNPTETRREDVRFALTVPVGTPPVSGWPVIIYAHGSGGDFQSFVNEGLASLLSSVDVTLAATTTTQQFAVLGFDAVAHGPRSGGVALSAEELFFNILNPSGAKGNVLQSAVDLLNVRRALNAVDAALAVAAPSVGNLDNTRVGFLGHSQGATSAAIAATKETVAQVVVLSGGGAGFIDTLTRKTQPLNFSTLIKLALADPTLSDGRLHPALSLVQGYMEEADPINYGPHVARSPFTGIGAKHVLHFLGHGDTFTPNFTGVTLARRLQGGNVDTENTALLSSLLTPPVKGNVTLTGPTLFTVVSSAHEPSVGEDGHFVIFDNATAQGRLGGFFASWLVENVPTVFP